LFNPQTGAARLGVPPPPLPEVPTPLNDTEFGDDGALLVIVSVPLNDFTLVGVKVTFSVIVWLGLSVALPEKPLTANEALATTALTVTEVLPVSLMVIVVGPLVRFRVSLPKFTDPGETVMPEVAATPVPLSEIFAGEFVALLLIVTVPVMLPATVGANTTFSTADWLGANTTLGLIPLVLNPAPITLTPEIVTLEFPVLVTVTPSELLAFTFTLPKARLDRFTERERVNAALTVIVKACEVLCAGDPESVTLAVKEELPAVVGVPLI
jgi:hypothetical protein